MEGIPNFIWWTIAASCLFVSQYRVWREDRPRTNAEDPRTLALGNEVKLLQDPDVDPHPGPADRGYVYGREIEVRGAHRRRAR